MKKISLLMTGLLLLVGIALTTSCEHKLPEFKPNDGDKEVTVSFDFQGSTNAKFDAVKVKVEGEKVVFTLPATVKAWTSPDEKEKPNLYGWSMNKNANATSDDEKSAPKEIYAPGDQVTLDYAKVKENKVTFYAIWAKKDPRKPITPPTPDPKGGEVTVTFELVDAAPKTGKSKPADKKVDTKTTPSLKFKDLNLEDAHFEPKTAGHTCQGWRVKATGSATPAAPNKDDYEFTDADKKAGKVTLQLVWGDGTTPTPTAEVTVSFELVGAAPKTGKSKPADMKVTKPSLELKDITGGFNEAHFEPTNTGDIFKGWRNKNDSKAAPNKDAYEFTAKDKADKKVTLVLVWGPPATPTPTPTVEVTVKFEVVGATGTPPADMKVDPKTTPSLKFKDIKGFDEADFTPGTAGNVCKGWRVKVVPAPATPAAPNKDPYTFTAAQKKSGGEVTFELVWGAP